MKGMSRFYRLIWEWLILIPAIVAAVLYIFPVGMSGVHGSRGAGIFLWILTIVFPAAMGTMLASRTAAIRSAEWAWALPGQRRILYTGSWHVLIGTVAFVSVLHFVAHGSPVVAAGIATLSFALPVEVMYGNHPVLGPLLAILLMGGLIGAADWYVAAVTQHGFAIGTCCFVAGVMVMRRTGRAEGYREAIFKRETFLSNYPARWMVIMGYAPNAHAPFKEGYRKRGHIGWIQSGFLANTSSLWPMVISAIWNAFYFVSMTYSFNLPVFVASPLMSNTSASAPLSTGVLYPIHRKTRAGVAVGMQVITLGIQIVFIGIMLGASLVLWPMGMDDPSERVYRLADVVPLILAMLMWLPILIWPRVTPSRTSLKKLLSSSMASRVTTWYVLPLIAFILLSLYTKHLYSVITQHIAAPAAMAAMVAGAIVTHGVLLLVMRDRFYRYDL